LDLERFEDESASLSLQAAGGNTRTARRLRVKSQLRDKKGRWVEMGRKASIDIKINGKKTKVQGRFVGSDPKAPGQRGLFLVEADEARGIKRGVYSFKGVAVNQVLATLDPEYLEDQGIKDPNRDVNGNLVGATLDEDIEELSEVDFEEVGELDEALASGKLSSDEVSQAFNERARAGAHESYNVVATLEEADTEVLTEEELGDILEDAGVTPETKTEAPVAPEAQKPADTTPVFDASKATDDELKAILKRDDLDDPKYSKASQEWAKRYGPTEFPGAPDFRTPVGTTRPGIRQYGGSWDPNDYVMGPNGYWVPQGSNQRGTKRSQEPVLIEDPARPKKPAQPKAEPTPAATFKTADRLVPGDEVKMPDGTFRKVTRNFTTDSGPQISFERREGERRETFKIYNDNDLVEIKTSDAKAEIPAPATEPAPTPEPVVEELDTNLPEPKWNDEKVRELLKGLRDYFKSNPRTFEGLDSDGLVSQETDDPDVREAIDMAYYMSDIIERSDSDNKDFLYDQLAQALRKNQADKVAMKPTDTPRPLGRADSVRKITARKEGATLDPITLSQPRTGIAVAVQGTNEEVADALFFNMYLGDLIVADYVDRNKDKLRDGFKLGTWHDKDNNEVTFDIVQVFPEGRIEEAKVAGQERNQQGIFNLKNKDYIPTGGTGDRGRARREREAQRQTGDGRGAGPELGQPEPIGEVREGQEPTPGDDEADGSDRDQLKIFRGEEDLVNVPVLQRGDIDYGELNFDLASLNARQRQILKKIERVKKSVFAKVTDAAKKGDLENFERNMTWGRALKDTFNRVFGDLSEGLQIRFGQGEKERLKNMTFFTNSEERNQDGVITKLEGVYVARNGEPFALKYSGQKAALYRIGPNGVPDTRPAASVDINWTGEQSRGEENEAYASIRYLASFDGGKGLAGAAVTFARYVVEDSNRNFAHSYNLTPQGSNNSKTIEPGDPRRHHFSQSEKVLQVMGAPVMKLLEKQGWFSGDYRIFSGDSSLTTVNKTFTKKLDVSGRTNNSGHMLGPIYKVDKGFDQLLLSYKRNVEKMRTSGAQVNVPEYAQDYLDGKGFGKYRLQFDLEELNWEDGGSKQDVINKLKASEELAKSMGQFFKDLPASERVGYQDYSSGLQTDTLARNFASIREALEAESDFDSKRMPRPDSLDRDLPKKVELKVSPQTFKELDSWGNIVPPAFEGISAEFGLQYFASPFGNDSGRFAGLQKGNYATATGRPDGAQPPAGWTTNASILARRFSVEQLRESLESGLTRAASTEIPTPGQPSPFYAELDFRRDFATEPELGSVPLLSVARALFKKSPTVDGLQFREYLAEKIDRAHGIQNNVLALDSEREANRDFFQGMDEYLSSIGETREQPLAEAVQDVVAPNSQPSVATSYDKEASMLRSDGETLDESIRAEAVEFVNNGRLIDNEEFEQLPNNLGEVLTQPSTYPEGDEKMHAYRMGINLENIFRAASTFLNRYRREDLVEAFKDALIKGNSSIRIEQPYVGYYTSNGPSQVDLDIRIARDILQMVNVDTNALIRSEVIPNLSDSPNISPERVKELNRLGFMPPKSVAEVVEKANEVVSLDNLTYVTSFDGSTSPDLYEDEVSGNKYVVKRYTNRLIAEMEITTQALYQANGVYASSPRFGLKSDDPNGVYVVTDYIPEMDNSTYRGRLAGLELDPTGEIQAEARAAVINGLPMDLLLDNLDGPFNSGNIVYDANGGYVRIDGGGGLLADPSDRHGNKKATRRYQAMYIQGWKNLETEEEQKRLLEIAKRDGSFEGQGIEFGYDFYLNPRGYHWNFNGGMRTYALEGFDEDAFKQRVRDSLVDFTPDKIAQIVDGMPITEDPRNKERIKEALIYRRSHILNRFGIDDPYDQANKDLGSIFATDADRERLNGYIKDAFKGEYSMDRIPFDKSLNAQNTTKEEIEAKIEELRSLIARREVLKDESLDAFVAESAKERFEKAVAEINASEEKPETDDLPVEEVDAFTTTFIDLADAKPGDIINDPLITTHNGKVIFNVRQEDGKYKVGIRDENGKLNVFDHDPVTLRHMRYVNRYASESQIPPETDFSPSLNEARERFIANIKQRSNSVLNAVKAKYVNHTVLGNGDLVVSSRNFTTAGGKSYKYQLVVHRKADEEFVAYVREWEVGTDGAAIGPVRINKMTTPTHSPKALLNKIAPLIQGSGVGQGVYGRNPRNWFNQGNSIEGEVTDPRTGMPIPSSLSVDPNVQFVEDTGIRSTGDPVKDAIISYVGKLVSRGVTASDIYRRLGAQNVFSRTKILDIIERVESSRAFPGINQIPYLSRNKRDIVRVGDRVRHYAPDGTIKEGTVRVRRPLSVSRKPNGDYAYTDVLVVKFDGRDQGTPIVAKNLEVISRSDGEAPDLGGEAPTELPREFTPELMPNLPSNWEAIVSPGDSGNVRFHGPDDAPLLTVNRVNDPFGRERFILHKYGSKDDGRTSRSMPLATYRFVNLPTALVTAENIIGEYQEAKLEKNETPEPASSGVKLFENAEPNDVVEAVKGNISQSPCAITASATEVCDITQGMRVRTVGEDVEIYHGDIAGVDAEALPVYRVLKTGLFGRGKRVKKIIYWTNPNDVGDMSKAREIRVRSGLSVEEAVEKIRKDAEERIEFSRGIPAGKTTRTLSFDLGNGETFTEEMDFETWKMFSLSPVSKNHFTLGDNGTVQVSEARLKYYQEQIKFHLSGIEPPQGRSPIMFVFGGSPASGKGGFTKKGSALSKFVKGETPEVREFNPLTGLETSAEGVKPTAVLVDPDVFKVRLPEVRLSHIRQIANRVLETVGLKKLEKDVRGDSSWANDSHEESSLMAKMVTQAAQSAGLDVVLDAVNAEKSKIKKKADQARAKGYKVVGRYLEASFGVTMPSAAKRSFNTGREVPIEVQLKSLNHLTKSLSSGDDKESRIWDIFDDFELFHRDGSTITEIATWNPDQKDPSQLNFTGSTQSQLEKTRDLHNEYIRMANLTEEERNAEIAEIRKRAEREVESVLERKELISSGQVEKLQKAEDALATDIELEVMSLLRALEARYPEYSTASLGNILRNLIDDLSTGKISDKEFGKLIGEAASGFKKGKKEVDLVDLGRSFVDATGFYKSALG
jgi:hypothetical protein